MDINKKRIIASVVSSFVLAATISAHATTTLQQSVARTVQTNPDILTTAKTRSASSEGVAQARAGYFPKVDLNADVGRERAKNINTDFQWVSLWRNQYGATLHQMLFDGFLTYNEVKRNKAKTNADAYRVQGAAEDTGLLAVQSYLDVLRTRELVGAAKKNVNSHNPIYSMITRRAKQGVGREADVDQASGRLSLAKANLLTAENDEANAEATFYKVTGMHADDLAAPQDPAASALPPDEETAVMWAVKNHPTLKAAIADVGQARAQHAGSKSIFVPRVDFVANANQGHNLGGVRGQTDDQTALLQASYNLFNGGADIAKVRETAYQVEGASETRNHTERLVIENMRLSWQALQTAHERVPYLRQHRDATAKTLGAYRSQFELNKRTLLDVLDSENEYFTAQSDYINGHYAEVLAKYRVLNAMGRLNQYLNVPMPAEASVPYADQDSSNNNTPAAPAPVAEKTWVANKATSSRVDTKGEGSFTQAQAGSTTQSPATTRTFVANSTTTTTTTDKVTQVADSDDDEITTQPTGTGKQNHKQVATTTDETTTTNTSTGRQSATQTTQQVASTSNESEDATTSTFSKQSGNSNTNQQIASDSDEAIDANVTTGQQQSQTGTQIKRPVIADANNPSTQGIEQTVSSRNTQVAEASTATPPYLQSTNQSKQYMGEGLV